MIRIHHEVRVVVECDSCERNTVIRPILPPMITAGVAAEIVRARGWQVTDEANHCPQCVCAEKGHAYPEGQAAGGTMRERAAAWFRRHVTRS